jgi:hypothetical protein
MPSISRRPRRRGQRGQAVVETAILAPFLMAMCLCTYDVGRQLTMGATVNAAALAGASKGVLASNNDVGSVIRSVVAPDIANSGVAGRQAWGKTFTGYAFDCTGANNCGDSGGCASASAFWTTPAVVGDPNPVACYAVGKCTINLTSLSPSCTNANTVWTARPATGLASGNTNQAAEIAVDVMVVIHSKPYTPLLQGLVGTTVTVARESWGIPLY